MIRHRIKGKIYTYIKLDENEREYILKNLKEKYGEIIKNHKFYVENAKLGDLFYLIGLTLSDGYIRKNYVYFETTDINLINCVVRSFRKITIEPKYKILETNKVLFSIYAKPVPKIKIPSNKEELAKFLAGVLDGDGAITKHSIRISVTKYSLIFDILNRFDLLGKYDEKKYLVTIKISKVADILYEIYQTMKHNKRKEKLQKILNRGRVFKYDKDLNIIDIIKNFEKLSKDEKEKILSFRIERNKNYMYIVYKYSEELLATLLKIFPGEVLKVDVKRKRIRIYKREIVGWLAGVHSPAL